MANPVRAFEFRVNREVLRKELTRMGKKVPQKMRTTFSEWGTYALKRFTSTRLSGKPGLRRRTGHLARSFYKRMRQDEKGLELRLASRAKYAKPLEEGATIRPKKAKRLAIPLGPALTPAGVYRFPQGPLRSVLPSERPNINFWSWRNPTTGKVFLLGQPKSGRGTVRAWFLLAKQVVLKPQLRFRRSMIGYHKVLVKRLRNQLKETIERG